MRTKNMIDEHRTEIASLKAEKAVLDGALEKACRLLERREVECKTLDHWYWRGMRRTVMPWEDRLKALLDETRRALAEPEPEQLPDPVEQKYVGEICLDCQSGEEGL